MRDSYPDFETPVASTGATFFRSQRSTGTTLQRWLGRASGALAFVLASGAGAPAWASLKELRHLATVRLQGATAHIEVERAFKNGDDTWYYPTQDIDLPRHAALTSFRLNYEGRWHPAKLLPQLRAEALYNQRIAKKASPIVPSSHPLALLHSDTGLPEAKFPALAPHQEVSVAYHLVVPTCYRAGRFQLSYPVRKNALRPKLVYSNGQVVPEADFEAPERWLEQSGCNTSSSGYMHVALAPDSPIKDVVARRASHRIGEQIFERVEFEVAPQLGPTPKDADVVFVVDTSKSAGSRHIRRQLDLVLALAEEFSGGSAQIVVFRRHAQTLLSHFVPMAKLREVVARIPPRQLAPGNGSHLDRGLELAATTLRARAKQHRIPRPTRIIALTDNRLRRGWVPNRTLAGAAALPSGTILHFATMTSEEKGRLTESTQQNGRLTLLAERTGGTSLVIDGSTDDPKANRAIVRHLIVPQRIDDFAIRGGRAFPLHEDDRDGSRSQLAAGSGLGTTVLWPRSDHPKSMWIEGRIWGRKLRVPVLPSTKLSQDLGALTVGDHRYLGLSKEGQKSFLARTAVLSPEMSFLVTDGHRVESSDLGFGIHGSGWGGT